MGLGEMKHFNRHLPATRYAAAPGPGQNYAKLQVRFVHLHKVKAGSTSCRSTTADFQLSSRLGRQKWCIGCITVTEVRRQARVEVRVVAHAAPRSDVHWATWNRDAAPGIPGSKCCLVFLLRLPAWCQEAVPEGMVVPVKNVLMTAPSLRSKSQWQCRVLSET